MIDVYNKHRRKLTTAEKADYIRAVKCLHEQLPAITTETVPGAVSRFDDFIGVHKLQTPYIHFVVRASMMIFSEFQITFTYIHSHKLLARMLNHNTSI